MFNWFNKLTFRRKNRYLFIGAILFGVIIWSFTIKKTFVLSGECKELRIRAEQIANAPIEAKMLTESLQKLDVLISKGQKAEGNIQQILLNEITSYCKPNGLLVREIPQSAIAKEKDYLIETNIFVVEGGFRKLLGLVYLFEQESRIGKVASIHFQTKKDTKSQTDILSLSLYIQNVKKIGDENNK